jgi:hypothetical protein
MHGNTPVACEIPTVIQGVGSCKLSDLRGRPLIGVVGGCDGVK